MHVFVLSRSATVATLAEDDPALDEEHWSYMDAFADGIIARGPLLAADRSTWMGSMHIVELPSAEAADEFVEREPYNRAGLFAEHVVLRFRTVLERTMWEWEPPEGRDDPFFLVLAMMREGAQASAVPWPALTRALRERTIILGELLTIDGGKPIGVVWTLQAASQDSLDAVLTAWPAAHDQHVVVETHNWEFGGRRWRVRSTITLQPARSTPGLVVSRGVQEQSFQAVKRGPGVTAPQPSEHRMIRPGRAGSPLSPGPERPWVLVAVLDPAAEPVVWAGRPALVHVSVEVGVGWHAEGDP